MTKAMTGGQPWPGRIAPEDVLLQGILLRIGPHTGYNRASKLPGTPRGAVQADQVMAARWMWLLKR